MGTMEYIAQVLGWTALHTIWQIVAVCILLKVVLLFIPATSYKSRLAVLGSGVILIVLSGLATFLYLFEPATSVGNAIENMPLHYYMHVAPMEEGYSTMVQWLEQNSYWMGMLWMLGSAVLLIYWGSGYFYLQKLRRHSTILEGRWYRKVRNWSRMAGRKGGLKIGLSPRVMSPVLTGIVQPIILIPAGMWQAFDDDQIECILRHEWLHWKRYDHLINLGMILFESLFFFHPLAWWLGREVRHLQELIVDKETVSHTQQPVQYAKTLYQVQQLALQPPLGMTAFSARKGKLFQRIERILSPSEHKKTQIMNTQSIGIIGISLLIIVMGGLGLGANSLSNDAGHQQIMPTKENIVFEEPFFTDTTPFEVDNFSIFMDAGGNVTSVQQKPNSVESKVVIKDRKGKMKKEVEVMKMTDKRQSVDYETSKTTIENEDGLKESIPQVIIRKPKQKETRKITIIKSIDGKQHRIELFNPDGEVLSDSMIITPWPEEKAQRQYSPPHHYPHDTLPSSEEWEEYERNMHEYSRRMAEWGQEYARKMQEHMINQDSLQKMVRKMQEHMSGDEWTDEEKEEFERKMEAYGERMEAWGERFGAAMEKWAEKYEAEMEKIGEEMESKMERMEMPSPPPPPPPPLPEHPETPPPPSAPDKG